MARTLSKSLKLKRTAQTLKVVKLLILVLKTIPKRKPKPNNLHLKHIVKKLVQMTPVHQMFGKTLTL